MDPAVKSVVVGSFVSGGAVMHFFFFWRQASVGFVRIVSRRDVIDLHPQVTMLATWWPWPSLYRLTDETFTDEEIEAIRVQYTEPSEGVR